MPNFLGTVIFSNNCSLGESDGKTGAKPALSKLQKRQRSTTVYKTIVGIQCSVLKKRMSLTTRIFLGSGELSTGRIPAVYGARRLIAIEKSAHGYCGCVELRRRLMT